MESPIGRHFRKSSDLAGFGQPPDASNSGTRPVQGWVELYGQTGLAARKRLAFGPGQTVKLDVGTLVRASKLRATFGGLRVRFDADGGFVQLAHLIYDESGGYSAILKPFDRGAPTDVAERHYIAAMVALSNPDPALALPSGTALTPEVILRNASDKPLAVDLSASWRDSSAWGIARLGAVSLNANETRVVSLDTYQQEGGAIPASASWAAVHAKYYGARGDLVAISAVHDSRFKYLLQSPFTDARSFSWRGGVWHVDSTHNSLITTGNAGDKPARVKATLRFGTGVYELPEKTLQPGESLWINVRELMQSQLPDRAGNTIPPDVTAGVYEFDQVDDDMIGSLYEGKLVLDSTYGQASYGCANCCGYYALGLSPDPFGIGIGFAGQDRIYVENACTGGVSERTTYGYNWATGNASIAGINSTGLLSAFTPGQTTSGASVTLRTPDVWHCLQATQGVGNAVKVMSVQITGANLANNTVNVTLSGPSGTSGTLEVIVNGVNNQPQVTANGGAALGPGQYSVPLTRPSMPPDTYSSVMARWNADAIPISNTYNLPNAWLVLGTVRHSQYNTPYESACSGTPQTAWVFNNSCSFTQVSLKSDFVSQTYINGTGASSAHGILKYNNGSLCSGSYPPGANTQNSFLTVSNVTGSCGNALVGGTSVATYPNPATVGNPFGCGDDLLLVTGGNVNQSFKVNAVQDYCPICNTQFNGTNGHVDNYSSSQACSGGAVGDLGNFWTANTH